jgi:L-threonylcarbamoyladenylate synthase
MTLVPANEDSITAAAFLLKKGKLVAFPTETVYGLGADAGNREAIQNIFKAKGRPAEHPLIVHIADSNQMDAWATAIPDAARRLAAAFWPGPLTLILTRQAHVLPELTGGQDTIALRVPNHPVALRLLQIFQGGIAAPSANRFCRISPTQALHVVEELDEAVDMVLDGGDCQVGLESTILDFSGSSPILLRPGQITPLEIEDYLPSNSPLAGTSTVRAPGMMNVHYAPTTPALLCPSEELVRIIQNLLHVNKKICVMAYSRSLPFNDLIQAVNMPSLADDYAQTLYSTLRSLDRQKPDVILVEQPPNSLAWQAINDRLKKATVPYQNQLPSPSSFSV